MVDAGIREISTSQPLLRRDIRTHYQEYRGKPSYIVEDTSDGKFYHIGFPEHQFIQSLDGHRNVSEAVAMNAATHGEDALTETQADQVLRWLIDNNLLDNQTTDQAERRKNVHAKRNKKKPKNWIQQAMFFKIPLGCPNGFLTRIAPFTKWTFSGFGLLLWLALLVYAGMVFAPHWEKFAAATGQVIAPGNWWRVGLIYALLKVLHEIGHGVAVKKYGGDVPSWGMQLLLFVTPLAFVDASASWKFPNRWHRILVAAAGMYVELAVAAVCLILWTQTDPGILNTTLHGAVVAASMVTLLFNANPLMRFDGYYILVDLLGIPNLGTKGNAFLKWFGKRVLLGMKNVPFPPNVRPHPIAIPLYGILAALWRVVIWAGIMTMLAVFLKGAGLALALASMALLLLKWIKTFATFLVSPNGPGAGKALWRIGLFLAAIAAILYFVKVDPISRIFGVVSYESAAKIRVGCDGEVVSVHVANEQKVKAGELLVTMQNPNEQKARDQMQVQLGEAKIRAHDYYKLGDLSAFQAERETIKGLQKSLAEKEEYLRSLILRAPIDGIVVGRQLDSLEGSWLRIGEELMIVDPGGVRELLLSISQNDMEAVRKRESDEIACLLRGRTKEIDGKIRIIESRATRAVPHEALASNNGGPLTIRNAPEKESERQKGIARGDDSELSHFAGLDQQQQAPAELVRPRIAARALISALHSSDIFEGEWGYVAIKDIPKDRLGVWLYYKITDYVKDLIQTAKDAANQGNA